MTAPGEPMKTEPQKREHCYIDLVLARLECRTCGGTLGLSLPMELKALARLAKAFRLNHKKCAPAPEAR